MSFVEDQGLDQFIAKKGLYYWCNLCNLSLNGLLQVRSHVAGENHKTRKIRKAYSNTTASSTGTQQYCTVQMQSALNSLTKSNLPPYIENYGSGYKCTLCNTVLNSMSQVFNHTSGNKHLKAAGSDPEIKSKYNFEFTSDFVSCLKNINSAELMKTVKMIKANEQIVF